MNFPYVGHPGERAKIRDQINILHSKTSLSLSSHAKTILQDSVNITDCIDKKSLRPNHINIHLHL